MMKLNKKGVGLVEIIVSLGLVSLVFVFALNILVDIRYEEKFLVGKGDNYITQAFITTNVQNDLINYQLQSVSGTKQNIIFSFLGGVSRTLNITSDTITYNLEAQKFNKAHIDITNIEFTNMKCNEDSLLKIIIPVIDERENHFDIEIIYVYKGILNMSVINMRNENFC